MKKTRLFSNKGKLTFQSKIDLLFDIEILSKEENSEFELLMNIRNKFLHDLECNSFKILFNENLKDNGLQNRFKKFLEEGHSISDEEACKKACYRLFQKNIDTIKKKISVNRKSIENKNKLFQVQNEQIIFYIDFIYGLLNKVSIATENAELENPKVARLGVEIQQILEDSLFKLNSESRTNIYEEFFNTDPTLKAVLGIKGGLNDLPKWADFKMENNRKSNN
jgi:hypothetical protein